VGMASMKLVVTVEGVAHEVTVEPAAAGYRVTLDEQVIEVDARPVTPGVRSVRIEGVSHLASVSADPTAAEGEMIVQVGGEIHAVRVEDAARHAIRTRGGAAGAARGQTVKAPLPGKITLIVVKPGDAVNRGDTLLVIEAMKMENELKAAAAGTVSEVHVSPGQAVNPGDVLVVIA
jgi:biotin carboxyl carrier protein